MKRKVSLLFFLFVLLSSIALVSAIDISNQLVHYYKFDNVTGSVIDFANGTANGTANGGVNRGEPGLSNNTFIFDGVNDAVTLTGSEFHNDFHDSITIATWVNSSWVGGQMRIIDRREVGAQFRLMVDSSGMDFRISTDGGELNAVSDHRPPADQWNFIVAQYNGTRLTVYYNDTEVAQGNLTGTISTISNDVVIGATNNLGSSFFNGSLDEMRIYNRSLSQADISDLYADGLARAGQFSLVMTLISPVNGAQSSNPSQIFNASLIPSNSNLTNATINVWFSNGTLFNKTTNPVRGFVKNYTFWNITLPRTNYIWGVFGCANDSTTQSTCVFSSNNSLEIQSFTVSTQTFNGTAFDTDLETFIVDVNTTAGASLFSATLLYGTNNSQFFPGTIVNRGGGQFTATKSIDVPVVSSNITQNFQWRFTFDTGGGFSTEFSSNRTQNVSFTNITTSGADIAVNFTIFDEDSLEVLDATFQGTLEWYLGTGTEVRGNTFVRNNSFILGDASSFNFYLSPTTPKPWNTDSSIFITNATTAVNETDHHDRFFDFRLDKFNDTTTNRPLFLLNSTRGREIIIEVKDTGLSPLEDYLVQIERFYPGENSYRIVESRTTDLYGQFVARLVESNVKYRFSFFDPNGKLVKSTSDLSIACRTSVCIVPFVLEDTTNYFERFENVTDFGFTLTFSNETNTFTFTWNDNTGVTSTKRLLVRRFLFNESTSVCDITSTSDIASLTCDVGDRRASYQAEVFRDDRRLTVWSVKVGSGAGIFGLEGMIWGFFLLFTLIIVGIFSPAVGITLYMIGFIGLGVTDIVYINPAILIAQLVIGILFIWAFRG